MMQKKQRYCAFDNSTIQIHTTFIIKCKPGIYWGDIICVHLRLNLFFFAADLHGLPLIFFYKNYEQRCVCLYLTLSAFICVNLRLIYLRLIFFLSTNNFLIQFSVLPCYCFNIKTGHRLFPGLYTKLFMALFIGQNPVDAVS